MRLLMVSGDRQVAVGDHGPFHAMLSEFATHFERIDILVPRPDRPVTVREPFPDVHVHPADRGRLAMAGWIARRGAELVAEHGAALVVSHDYGWFYNGIGSARLSARTGVPYVSEIHHVPGFPVAADLRERFDRAVARRYVRWARGRARAFRVVNAGEMVPLLESWGVPREQIAVLPSLYIDLETFAPAASPTPREQDVTFVGRLVANKGLDRIVAALAELNGSGRRTTALFVGKGPLAARVRADVQARGLEHLVRFVEWVDSPADLAAIYRSSGAVVCASTCEGGPRFTVEAMACGTPVVSTRVGMMGELLEDGRAGRLVGFDAASLAGGLAEVLDDEGGRAARAEAARAAASAYERRATIRGYAEGLKRLAGVGR